MPSPFPGMDPYLEGTNWMPFHSQLNAEIARQLAPRIRPRYVARVEKRFIVTEVDDLSITTGLIYPDVGFVETDWSKPNGSGSLMVAPLQLETVVLESIPHLSVQIRDVANKELITAIEVLSSTNKQGKGREEYLQKRNGILQSSANLIEIDLLRMGQRPPMRKPLPVAPYFVFISRECIRPMTDIWPIALGEALPTIPVPLREPEEFVPLDLQLAMTTIYDLLGYDLEMDYRKPPEIPLSRDDSAWAEGVLEKLK